VSRFAPLLDQIGDLRDTVITVDAMDCQREHVAYLAERGVGWILTVKGNQPTLLNNSPPCPGGPCPTPPAIPTAGTADARSAR
jgi:hypothetical protein